MKMLREASPADQPPVAVFSMRGQAHLRAFQDGQLHLPEEAINLYNDKGSTARFLTRPTPEDLRRHKNNGVYFHLTYCDNQWVQWVSPALIEEELTKAVDDGMTRMAILNVGDIREIPLSLSAGMAFLYNDQPWIAKDDYASAYTKKWCTFQYGDEAGPAIARLLENYFTLEYPTRASTVIESFQGPLLGLLPKVFKNWQDRTLMDAAEAASGNAEQLARDLGGYDPAQEGLASRFGQLGAPYLESVQDHWSDLENRAEALSAKVPASAKDFYYFSVTLQIKSSRLANQFGLSMYRAIEAVKNQRFAEAAAGFERAAQQIMAFQTIRDAADHGKWKDWHKGEHIVGWNGIPWGTTSSWSVHSERVAGALRRLAEICRAQVAENASTEPAGGLGGSSSPSTNFSLSRGGRFAFEVIIEVFVPGLRHLAVGKDGRLKVHFLPRFPANPIVPRRSICRESCRAWSDRATPRSASRANRFARPVSGEFPRGSDSPHAGFHAQSLMYNLRLPVHMTGEGFRPTHTLCPSMRSSAGPCALFFAW
jgi:hypothetical protein